MRRAKHVCTRKTKSKGAVSDSNDIKSNKKNNHYIQLQQLCIDDSFEHDNARCQVFIQLWYTSKLILFSQQNIVFPSGSPLCSTRALSSSKQCSLSVYRTHDNYVTANMVIFANLHPSHAGNNFPVQVHIYTTCTIHSARATRFTGRGVCRDTLQYNGS